MKVEHAFLPKGELVLLIHVQSEEDRQDLNMVLGGDDRYMTDTIWTIHELLGKSKEFFKPEEKK